MTTADYVYMAVLLVNVIAIVRIVAVELRPLGQEGGESDES